MRIHPHFVNQAARDYMPPQPDRSRVKLRIVRPCLVQLVDNAEPVRCEAGELVTVPRFVGQQVVDAGRGEII